MDFDAGLRGDQGEVTPLFGQRPEAVAAYLFGSAAGGHVHAESDIDIALLIEKGTAEELDRIEPYDYKASVIAELSQALGTDKIRETRRPGSTSRSRPSFGTWTPSPYGRSSAAISMRGRKGTSSAR